MIPVTCVTYVKCVTYKRFGFLDPSDICEPRDMRDIHFDYLKKCQQDPRDMRDIRDIHDIREMRDMRDM